MVDKIQQLINVMKEELTEGECNYMVVQMLQQGLINFVAVSLGYTQSLEKQQEKIKRYKSLASGCIASFFSPCSTKEWQQSQAYVLINKHVPQEFIDKYLNNRTDTMVKKNEQLLEE